MGLHGIEAGLVGRGLSRIEQGGGNFHPAAGGDAAYELRVDTLFASGDWIAPADLDGTVKVELIGAGGGSTEAAGEHYAGGGGAYARLNAFAATPESAYAVVIGASVADADGGDTTFNSTSCVAKGGLSGGNGSTGGSAASSTGDAKFDGGDGARGTGGLRIGGASAGDTAAGAGIMGGTTWGAWGNAVNANGYGFGGSISAAAATLAGARGEARLSYLKPVTAGRQRVTARTFTNVSLNASHPVDLPAAEVGDLLLVVTSISSNATLSVPEDWTIIVQDVNSIFVRGALITKIAEGSDTLTCTISAAHSGAYIAMTIKNGALPDATANNSASAANANPPSHSPAGGSGDYLWLAAAAWNGNAGPAVTGIPSGYNSFVWFRGRDSVVGVCERFATASSEDPGAFTSSAEQYVAITVAIPAAA